jgi:formate hydrogenlyase subunit 6/NADH:ubiquinone oxidoreductase subunit I
MWLSQLPAIPAQRPVYDLDELKANVQTFQKLYPEIFRCVACNTCTKACPQDLEVMDYIQAAKRGDIEKVMDLSFDCLSCGLCAIRCPAEIVHYNVGILGRRLYGKYLIKKSEHLEKRIKEVKAKKYDSEYKEMMKMKKDELKKKYYARDSE